MAKNAHLRRWPLQGQDKVRIGNFETFGRPFENLLKIRNLNYVVPDTAKWEQAAAYYIDRHELVDAFAKNAGLGFAIPYLFNGQMHDYMPDFIIRLKTDPPIHLILETKGYDPREEVKRAAAERWVSAVNAVGSYGCWVYSIVKKTTDVTTAITYAAESIAQELVRPQ